MIPDYDDFRKAVFEIIAKNPELRGAYTYGRYVMLPPPPKFPLDQVYVKIKSEPGDFSITAVIPEICKAYVNAHTDFLYSVFDEPGQIIHRFCLDSFT